MANVQLDGVFGAVHRYGNLSVTGRALCDSRALGPAELAQEIRRIEANQSAGLIRQLGDFLTALDGFFSFIWETEETIYLCTDRSRSRPIFYQFNPQSGWFISDRIETLKRAGVDPISQEEFRCTGYVTGHATLDTAISQLEAGSVIALSRRGGIDRRRYHDHFPKSVDVGNRTDVQALDELTAVVASVLDGVIEHAAGRQLVVPLSGGADSRAILAYLATQGYSNLLAFTFGTSHSSEVAVARQVAESLGVRWHNVTYSRAMWRGLFGDAGFLAYLQRVHSLVSVPNLQVYPAVKTLLQTGVIDSSAIVLAGHSDLFAGGPWANDEQLSSNKAFDVPSAVEYLWKTHYRYRCPETSLMGEVRHKLAEQVSDLWQRAPGSVNSRERWVATVDAWNHRERQAKFIGNSNRYFDVFGLEWWMPLWQEPFADFWRQVPLSWRIGKRLWRRWIDHQMLAAGAPAYVVPYIKGYDGRITSRLSLACEYFADPNALFATVPFGRWFTYRYFRSQRDGSVFGTMIDRALSNHGWIDP
jgi:asparagine synthase (glutamine-hydrolysing)